VREGLGQHLDRHLPSQIDVGGAIDLAHPAGAKEADQFIRPARVRGWSAAISVPWHEALQLLVPVEHQSYRSPVPIEAVITYGRPSTECNHWRATRALQLPGGRKKERLSWKTRVVKRATPSVWGANQNFSDWEESYGHVRNGDPKCRRLGTAQAQLCAVSCGDASQPLALQLLWRFTRMTPK
jgi:hypothetical protein